MSAPSFEEQIQADIESRIRCDRRALVPALRAILVAVESVVGIVDYNVETRHRAEAERDALRLRAESAEAEADALRRACVQARGALRLDAMVDDEGNLFGTTVVALDALAAMDRPRTHWVEVAAKRRAVCEAAAEVARYPVAPCPQCFGDGNDRYAEAGETDVCGACDGGGYGVTPRLALLRKALDALAALEKGDGA